MFEPCPFQPLASHLELRGNLIVLEHNGGYLVAWDDSARRLCESVPTLRLRQSWFGV